MKKRLLAAVFVLLIAVLFTLPAHAEQGTGKAYTYDHKNSAVAVPDPYTVYRTLYGGRDGFSNPVDLVSRNGSIYILNDDGSASITVLNSSYEVTGEIRLTKTGNAYGLSQPRSIWVDNDGTLLIADSGKQLVIRASSEGEVLAEYTKPDTGTAANETFTPYKVLTDYLGRIYVLSEGEYRGILRMTENGEFMSFFGSKSIRVTAGVLLDMFWRNFMSDEQIANSARYLPTEYSNMTIDDKGFLFVTSASSSDPNQYIVKLNSNGNNVLEAHEYGDYNLGHFATTYYCTSLNAITVDEEGFITVADKTWNRLMQYSSEGELLYIFGGQGDSIGTFSENAQIASVGSHLLVVDRTNHTITVLEPTDFGKNVRSGYTLYEQGLFEASIAPWQRVLDSAGNYEAAYIGIGKALQLKGDYAGAMEYFRKGYSAADYSDAYARYRSIVMRRVFPAVMTVIVCLIILLIVVLRWRRRTHPKVKKPPLDRRGKISYLLYTMIHPFDGFAEMRYNGKGSLAISNVLVLLWFLLEALKFNYRGFIFNSNEPEDFSLFALLATTVGLSFAFCLSNWLLATFFEGKGTFKNVWIHFGYGLVPMLAGSVLDLILSNVLTLDESFFIQYIGIFGAIYTVFLIFVGNGELHQYSFRKNLFSCLVSLVGVLVILFVIFLLFNLFLQVKDFAESVLEEIVYRINVGFS